MARNPIIHPPNEAQIKTAAARLAGHEPEELMAFAVRADGSVAVVVPGGKKYVYSAAEILHALEKFVADFTAGLGQIAAKRKPKK